ncbi:hypothetical protein [Rhizobium mongolense]|uniref:Uncharacterized protein n=1 Tax=Rhizobium mongolense TaxID=57676 RepID=A0A7W6RUW8_9HYPH|nr:hypothetical protein [Rhizobium mongolense]MBB4279013.1 hypothetical protein [Rhizobium mongolense]
MAELTRAARLIAGGQPLANDTVEGVSSFEPDPGRQAAISGARRIIGRHLPL